MEKVACFFCDITGTIIGNKKNENSDYQIFNNILAELKQKTYVDFIIFSLISTDSKEVVFNQQNILKQYLDKPVYFGKQFFENGYINNHEIVYQEILGKPLQIYKYIKELEEKYFIHEIYYVDDCEIYHEILSFYAKVNNWNEKLYSIIPSENNGLTEVNKLLKFKYTPVKH